jgi:hypothetical protein
MFVYFDTYYQHGRDSKEVYSNDQTAQTAFIPDFPLWFTYYCAKLSSEIQSHPDSLSYGHRRLLDLIDPLVALDREAPYTVDAAGWFTPTRDDTNSASMISAVDTQLNQLRKERISKLGIYQLFYKSTS